MEDSTNKETVITKTLRIAKILKKYGVNFSKIRLFKYVDGKQKSTLLKEIQQDGIDIEKIIMENNLDGDFFFGRGICTIRVFYNSKFSHYMTQEQRDEAKKLGLLEKEKKESAISETLKIAKILKENGVDLKKVVLWKDLVRDKRKYTKLKEIEQEGIDINKIIEENRLNGELNWGGRVVRLRVSYNGKGNKITEEEKQQAEELGLIINLESKKQEIKNAVDQYEQAKNLYEQYENYTNSNTLDD